MSIVYKVNGRGWHPARTRDFKEFVYVSPTPTYQQPEPQPRSGLLTALVAGALIALVAANIYLYVQIDHVRTDLSKTRASLMTELSNIRDASSVTSASQTRHLQSLKDELEAARAQAANAART